MNNSLSPRERGKSPPGYRAKSSFLSSLQKKKEREREPTKSYQHSAFSAIGAQIIDYV